MTTTTLTLNAYTPAPSNNIIRRSTEQQLGLVLVLEAPCLPHAAAGNIPKGMTDAEYPPFRVDDARANRVGTPAGIYCNREGRQGREGGAAR